MQNELKPSKTQRKKEMQSLQGLGSQLAKLTPQQLEQFSLPESLCAALGAFGWLRSHEARRRHLQYIGKLMRELDPVPVQQRLLALQNHSRVHTAKLHLAEYWRDKLLDGNSGLDELAKVHPHADFQQLHTLTRAARKEKSQNARPKHARALFRALYKIVCQEPLSEMPAESNHEPIRR
jgi:ribosome-associated protein